MSNTDHQTHTMSNTYHQNLSTLEGIEDAYIETLDRLRAEVEGLGWLTEGGKAQRDHAATVARTAADLASLAERLSAKSAE